MNQTMKELSEFTTQELVNELGRRYVANLPLRALQDIVRSKIQVLAANEMTGEAEELFAWLCDRLEVTPPTMLSERKPRWLATKRAIAMWVVVRGIHPSPTLCEVGRLFCRDHGTVIYNVNRVEASPEMKSQSAHLLRMWEGVQP